MSSYWIFFVGGLLLGLVGISIAICCNAGLREGYHYIRNDWTWSACVEVSILGAAVIAMRVALYSMGVSLEQALENVTMMQGLIIASVLAITIFVLNWRWLR